MNYFKTKQISKFTSLAAATHNFYNNFYIISSSSSFWIHSLFIHKWREKAKPKIIRQKKKTSPSKCRMQSKEGWNSWRKKLQIHVWADTLIILPRQLSLGLVCGRYINGLEGFWRSSLQNERKNEHPCQKSFNISPRKLMKRRSKRAGLTHNSKENDAERWRFQSWLDRFLGTICFLLQKGGNFLLSVWIPTRNIKDEDVNILADFEYIRRKCFELTSHLQGSNFFGSGYVSGSKWTPLNQTRTFHPLGIV